MNLPFTSLNLQRGAPALTICVALATLGGAVLTTPALSEPGNLHAGAGSSNVETTGTLNGASNTVPDGREKLISLHRLLTQSKPSKQPGPWSYQYPDYWRAQQSIEHSPLGSQRDPKERAASAPVVSDARGEQSASSQAGTSDDPVTVPTFEEAIARAREHLKEGHFNGVEALLLMVREEIHKRSWKSQEEARHMQDRLYTVDSLLADAYHGLNERAKEFETLMNLSYEAIGGSHASDQIEIDKRALTVAESINNLPDIARAIEAYQTALYSSSPPEKLVPLIERAMKIRKAEFDPKEFAKWRSQPTLSPTEPYLQDLRLLADCYDRMKRYDKAGQLLEEYVSTYEKYLGDGHHDTINAYREIARHYYLAKKFASAESNCKKALALEKKYMPDDRECMLSSLNLLFYIYQYQDKDREAEQIAKEQLVLAEAVKGKSSRYVAGVLECYAEVLRHDGRASEARPLEKRAQEIRLATHTKPKRQTGAALLKSR